MIKSNGYWIDDNRNKWSCEKYTEEQAKHMSKTLIDCKNCIDCSRCSGCSGCSGCSRCSRCSDCSRCSGCSGCSRCSDFKDNPMRLSSNKIGSRESMTTIYFNCEKVQVVCGCFTGTIDEFKKRINDTHGDNEYAKQYFGWLEIAEKYIEDMVGKK